MEYLRVGIAAALVAGVTAGCSSIGNVDALRARAAFDFQCAQDQLQLTQLATGNVTAAGAGAVYGVAGCGHRGTYVRPPGTMGDTWILNSGGAGVEAMGQPTPAPAAAPVSAPK